MFCRQFNFELLLVGNDHLFINQAGVFCLLETFHNHIPVERGVKCYSQILQQPAVLLTDCLQQANQAELLSDSGCSEKLCEWKCTASLCVI